MTTQAKAIVITEQGAPSVLKLESVELPDPGVGEVLIRQTAIGVNFMDVYQRSGAYPLELPSGIGLEAAGVIKAVGAGVSNLKPGDRVAYGGGAPGAYADHRILPAARVVTVPDGVSDEDAAAVMMKGMTAEYLLNRAYKVKSGEWALFHAAAGGVGLLAGQWGKELGARMIGIAGGPEKCQLALDHGYEVCIDRKSEDVVARVKELTGGKGVPVVYDSIGKDTFEQTLDCLAPKGYFIAFGTTSGPQPPMEAKTLQMRGSLYYSRPTMVDYCIQRDDLVYSAGEVFKMVAAGKLRIEILQRYPLADVVKAHEDLEAAKTKGSTLLLP